MSESGIFVAKETFATVIDGDRVVVKKGKTRVRAGHPLLEGREHLFQPVDESVRFDVETARQEPPAPPAPAKKAAAAPAKKAASSANEDSE